MRKSTVLLTICQVAKILNIKNTTLTTLVQNGRMPYLEIPASGGNVLRFKAQDVLTFIERAAQEVNTRQWIKLLSAKAEEHKENLKGIHELDKKYAAYREPKGYYLHKEKHTKLGFVYYVRYSHRGKTLTTRTCTHTNDEDSAHIFAIENRERIISEYLNDKSGRKTGREFFNIFREYYKENSTYLEIDRKRGRVISERARQIYHNAVQRYWIPFLKKERVLSMSEIDTPLLARFQNYCLNKNIKPQTINHYVSHISHIFNYLLVEGVIKLNPFIGLKSLKISETDITGRGCYDINLLKGVFNKKWDDELSYLLCLVIYTTNMRNAEIDQIHIKDIMQIENTWFLHIPKSKSRNGERLVPIHDFVYKKLSRYIKKNEKSGSDLLFCQKSGLPLPRQRYTNANRSLGKFTGFDKETLRNENLTFYSGRHFWKTLMNAGGLGDIEEVFMGHKVSNDVAKRYNHKDKQGHEILVKKAREVFAILDRYIFRVKYSETILIASLFPIVILSTITN